MDEALAAAEAAEAERSLVQSSHSFDDEAEEAETAPEPELSLTQLYQGEGSEEGELFSSEEEP